MEIPSIKIRNRNWVGYESQKQLVEHLGLNSNEPIPWSFTINEIVSEIRSISDELTESIDWGSHSHHKQRSESRPSLLDEIPPPIDLMESINFPGSEKSLQKRPRRPRNPEKNDKKKRRLKEVESELYFYIDALILAQRREKNEHLRWWLIRWIRTTIETSTRTVMKRTGCKFDKYKNRKCLVFDGITDSTSDDETTIRVNTTELTRRPIRTYVRKGISRSIGGEALEKKHSKAVLYIDWRKSRISSEQSWRGKVDSFWHFMLNWIKDGILEEVIEALILGVFKGVTTAIKGIYRTAKYLRKARKYKRLRSNEVELGNSASSLKNALSNRRSSPETNLNAKTAKDQQRLSKTGDDRATGDQSTAGRGTANNFTATRNLLDGASGNHLSTFTFSKNGNYAQGNNKIIRLFHGTSHTNRQAIEKHGIDVKHPGDKTPDFSDGFYMTFDSRISEQAASRKTKKTRANLVFELPTSELGRIVDVREGGIHGKLWQDFLLSPPFIGDNKTWGELMEFPANRAHVFEVFLGKYNLTNADTIIGAIGDKYTSGLAAIKDVVSNQIVIRNQEIADILNAQIIPIK